MGFRSYDKGDRTSALIVIKNLSALYSKMLSWSENKQRRDDGVAESQRDFIYRHQV